MAHKQSVKRCLNKRIYIQIFQKLLIKAIKSNNNNKKDASKVNVYNRSKR